MILRQWITRYWHTFTRSALHIHVLASQLQIEVATQVVTVLDERQTGNRVDANQAIVESLRARDRYPQPTLILSLVAVDTRQEDAFALDVTDGLRFGA